MPLINPPRRPPAGAQMFRPNMPAAVAAARPVAAPNQPHNIAAVDDLIRRFVNAQPWTYYDTFTISAYLPKGNAAVVNFANIQTPITFFKRTKNSNGLSITNMASDKSEFDQNFVCVAIALDVLTPSDIASATGKALATTFTELIVMNSVFTIEMGDDLILAKPAIELPSGGGVYSTSRSRTLAVAADTANADANNGFPAADGLMYLAERLVFEKNQSFSANLHINTGSGTAGPLAAINALTALAGNDNVSIRVRMIGVRGEKLLKGTPRATSAAAR